MIKIREKQISTNDDYNRVREIEYRSWDDYTYDITHNSLRMMYMTVPRNARVCTIYKSDKEFIYHYYDWRGFYVLGESKIV